MRVNTTLTNCRWYSLDSLKTQDDPHRDSTADLQLLQDSIDQDGLKVPILIDKKTMTIIDGERRYLAIKNLYDQVTEVPVVEVNIGSNGTNQTGYLHSVICNLTRTNPSLVETVRLVDRLATHFGYSYEYIGRSIGISERQIRKYVVINTLPAKFLNELEIVGVEKATLVSTVEDPLLRDALWDRAKEGATVSQLKALIASETTRKQEQDREVVEEEKPAVKTGTEQIPDDLRSPTVAKSKVTKPPSRDLVDLGKHVRALVDSIGNVTIQLSMHIDNMTDLTESIYEVWQNVRDDTKALNDISRTIKELRIEDQ